MKKLLLSIALLFAVLIQAQDNHTIQLMTESNSLDEIKTVSDKIISSFTEEYKYYKTASAQRGKNEKYQYVYYIPKVLNPIGEKLTPEEKERAVIVKFGQYEKGENIDLAIKGKTVYYFKEVSGKYLDLTNFWIASFYPSSTKEQILEAYKLQEYRVNKDLKYNFRKNENTWTIEKGY